MVLKNIQTRLKTWKHVALYLVTDLSCMVIRGWLGVLTASFSISACLSSLRVTSWYVVSFSPVLVISSRWSSRANNTEHRLSLEIYIYIWSIHPLCNTDYHTVGIFHEGNVTKASYLCILHEHFTMIYNLW